MDDVEAGQGMQLYKGDTGSTENHLIIVNLKPTKGYRFQVAGLSDQGQIVPGTAQRSALICTQYGSYLA